MQCEAEEFNMTFADMSNYAYNKTIPNHSGNCSFIEQTENKMTERESQLVTQTQMKS